MDMDKIEFLEAGDGSSMADEVDGGDLFGED